eukprot:1932360-Ditylum_brightwellii.AAC.1
MKDCPTAEQAANFVILVKISGLAEQYAKPEPTSPSPPAMTSAVRHIYKLVQNIKSYGLGLTPAFSVSTLRRFWKPAVTPSSTRERTM